MRATGIQTMLLLAMVFTWAQICLAQQNAQSQAAAVVAPAGTASPVQTSGRESWRLVNHQGNWWYYHPNRSWSLWNGNGWSPYELAPRQSEPSGVSAGVTNLAGPRVTSGNSKDVEASGADLGMGVGADRNSGLSNRPNSPLNGKGGMGDTQGGAGARGLGRGVAPGASPR